MKSKYIQTIDYEDLPEELQNIADIAGMETVHKLVEHFGGVRIYIPRPESFAEAVKRYIIDNYTIVDGRSNIRDLSRQTGVTPEHVRRIYRNRSK
jgi:Mor family transcriptional regulator